MSGATLHQIEIFRAGTHTATNGKTIPFTAADLAATAAAYDPAAHEAPGCVGHPVHDMPAYAWVKGLTAKGDSLIADLDQVDPAFADMVKAGRFKKISAAFYEPDSPNNPTPGVYALRHVGFLGAQPPAVKGLKPVAFDGGEKGFLAFGDYASGADGARGGGIVAKLLRNIREHIIGHDGLDAADRVLPSGDIDFLAGSAATPDTDGDTTEMAETTAAAFAERERALKEREDALTVAETKRKSEELAFAERDKATRAAANETFLAGLITAGKLLPAHKPMLLAFLERLHGGETVSFGEGAAKQDKAADAAFRDFLGTLPKQVTFSEVAKAGIGQVKAAGVVVRGDAIIDADRAELHAKALQYQEAHQGTDYLTAVKAVEAQA